MNVYDFDKTIFDGDSASMFFFYSIKKNPKLMASILKLPVSYLRYKMKTISRTQMKQSLYRYVTRIDNLEEEAHQFWQEHFHLIKDWYLNQQKEDDLIISASPAFLIQPICEQLGVNWIASKLDPQTGKFDGSHCYAEHKITYYLEKYEVEAMEAFYSDSLTDTPMAKLAKRAYFVKGNQILGWPQVALADQTKIYD